MLYLLACAWIVPAPGDRGDSVWEDSTSSRETGGTPVDGDGDGVPVEEDCDDGDAAVGAAHAWYADQDADGWGGSGLGVSCDGPSGAVERDGDCDESDAAVHPEAEEVCGDGVDQDCDGSAGVCGWPAEVDLTTGDRIVGDSSTLGLGRGFGAIGDTADNLSGVDFAVVADGTTGSGGVLVFEGLVHGEVPAGAASFQIATVAGLSPHATKVRTVDFNGGDKEDVCFALAGAPPGGQLVTCKGPEFDITVDENCEVLDATAPGTGLGFAMVPGDFDGDGHPELAWSALEEGGTPGPTWGVDLLHYEIGGGMAEAEVWPVDALPGEGERGIGHALEVGDFAGDGDLAVDLAIGVPDADEILVAYGPWVADGAGGGAFTTVETVHADDSVALGSSLAVLPDQNGDTFEELAASDATAGVSYVFHGGPSDRRWRSEYVRITSAGGTVARAPDVDGDDRDDLLVCDLVDRCGIVPVDEDGELDLSEAPVLLVGGRVETAEAADLDADGDLDLMLGLPDAEGGAGAAVFVYGYGGM